MKFIQWLKSLFTKKEREEMSDQSVVEPVAATPAVTETATTSAEATDQSPLEKAKAKFDAFVEFVEHGLEVLGKEAEADLVALKDKFL